MNSAVDRRTLLATGSAAMLAGCAIHTVPRRAGAIDCQPLAPVKVDERRVIRTVAGLRPYRRSGFVVRAEPLGGKRLVHNYGHGGAGITLSWGSSRLATNLGLSGHSGPVAVIGAGIMGLTTARLAQESGHTVTIYADKLPPETTSNIAGGQWGPFGHFQDSAVTPAWRQQFRAAAEYSWRRFQIMVGEDYGVRWLPTYNETSGRGDESIIPNFPAGWQMLSGAEHPFPLTSLSRYDTIYVETGRFLARLMQDIQVGGGRTQIRQFTSPAELLSLPEQLIFNCTGLGARSLFGDDDLIPVRGQLAILIPQPEVRYAFTGDAGYMFPRPDGVVLGGTFERNIWDETPDPADIAAIVRRHKRLFEGFRCLA